jgi:hypothetical protein
MRHPHVNIPGKAGGFKDVSRSKQLGGDADAAAELEPSEGCFLAGGDGAATDLRPEGLTSVRDTPASVNSLHPGSSILPNCGNALLQILLK